MHWNRQLVCLSRVCVAIATEDQHVVVAVVKFIHNIMVMCVLRTNHTHLILFGASLLSLNTDRARVTGCGL